MKTINLNRKSVEIYDDIESLPIKRFHKYNKLLLIDAGIGSDLNDIDAHIAKVMAFVKDEKKDEAVAELQNMRQNIYFIQSGISPRMLAFTSLIKSIDGQTCDDLSDDGLMKVYESIGNTPTAEITSLFSEVKKKIDNELRLYFPQFFEDSKTKEYHNILRKRALAQLEEIINGKDSAEADELDIQVLTYTKPRDFTDGKAEIEHDKAFEKMCIVISQQLSMNPKKCSVLEFYTALQYIKDEQKAAKKAKKA